MDKREMLNTPCFVIRTEIIESLVEDAISSMHKFWKDGIIGYSFKTNNLPWLISYMKEKGLWAEVVSSDEFQLAKELGYDLNRIIFNGPVKGKMEFIEAVENGAIVNIDSKRELKWLLECNKEKVGKSKLGLRVNFCLEEYCPGESQCSKEDGRFGFSYEMGELGQAIDFCNKYNIPLVGLHLHCSSKTRSLNIYKAIAEVAVEIVKRYNLRLEFVDIGGGYFGGVTNKPSFSNYFQLVYNIFDKEALLENTNIIIEPGMSVVGAGIDYISTVVDVKKTKNNNFITLDGSRTHIDPLMKKTGYTYQIERKKSWKDDTGKVKQILCGFTCMEGDRFFTLEGVPLHEGDLVIFQKVGAYTMGLSPQFIEFYPSVYVQKQGQMKKIRSKCTAKKFCYINEI